ncbi:MAG: hypothetical protein C0506_00690 [Anaerolinea sp.]|nr:hypothetical protein [Anaerolinea sp.]
MQDRPTVDELLEAVAGFLRDDVMTNTTGRINFHARVSSNVLEMMRRELNHREEHLGREWAGLDGLLGLESAPASFDALQARLLERNRDLAGRIKDGFADDADVRGRLLAHLRTTVHDKLVVSNPALAADA